MLVLLDSLFVFIAITTFDNKNDLILDGSQSIALVRSIFNCQFERIYLEHINGGKHVNTSQQFMTRNRRMWEACYHRESLCFQPEYVGRLCGHFSVQLMKVVRMRLSWVQQLLQHFIGDTLQIIYLVSKH